MYGKKPEIVVYAHPNGALDVAWIDNDKDQIVLSHVTRDGDEYRAAWHLELETLNYLGGFARDEDNSIYYLTAVAEDLQHEMEPSGVQREDIIQLFKLTAGGELEYRIDLRTDATNADATPIYDPMTAGTGRLAVGDGRVMTTFSQHGEYDEGVSGRHQWQIYIPVDAATGELGGRLRAPSHSFDQRVFYDGQDFVGMALGDASLRGVGLAKLSDGDHKVAFAIKGGDSETGGGYNNTFTRLGNVQPGEEGYVAVFSTENDATSTGDRVIASRNLAFVHVVEDFETIDSDEKYDVQIVDTGEGNDHATTLDVQILDYWGEAFDGNNRGLVWLTDYTDRENEHVERPKVVRIAEDAYAVVWEKWTLKEYVTTEAVLVDEYGNVQTEKADLGPARLNRGDDLVRLGDRAAWVVGEADAPQLVLYTLDEQLELARHEIK
ncbi:MAG: hypothetical protein B7733_10405 [Myxococcales bacterium FL481]|nr:MAG: hypothetical protein B7733_10405 [Myxococcales bacterium FL481]